MQLLAIDLQRATCHENGGLAALGQREFCGVGAVQQAGVDGCVGVQRHHLRQILGGRRRQQLQLATRCFQAGVTLGVTGWQLLRGRLDPDLQEVRLAFAVGVLFAVQHAGAGRHALDLARQDGRGVAHAVGVRQRTFQHIAHDFHVAVAVATEAGAGINAVFVDHPQIAPAHPARVVVFGKGKQVPAVKPAVAGMAAFMGTSNGKHGHLLIKAAGNALPMPLL